MASKKTFIQQLKEEIPHAEVTKVKDVDGMNWIEVSGKVASGFTRVGVNLDHIGHHGQRYIKEIKERYSK